MTFRLIFLLICVLFSSVATAVNSSIPTERFTQEADFQQAALSPDGHYLAEVLYDAKTKARLVHVLDLTKKGTPVIGNVQGKFSRPYGVTWANSERLLVHMQIPIDKMQMKRDKRQHDDFDIDDYATKSRTVAMDPDGSHQVQLMYDENADNFYVRNLSHIRHLLPNDPRHILMEGSKNGRWTLFKVDVYKGTSEYITHGDVVTNAILSNAAGEPKYRVDYRQLSKKVQLFSLDSEGDWHEVYSFDLNDADDSEMVSELFGLYHDKFVYRRRNADTGFFELAEFDLNTKQFKTLVSVPHHDISAPLMSKTSYDIIGYMVDGDVQHYQLFDKNQQQRYDLLAKKFTGMNFYIESTTSDNKLAIIVVENAQDPGSYFLYNQVQDKLQLLSHAYFDFSIQQLAKVVPYDYKARDDLAIHSLLLIPPQYQPGKRFPLVVYPHGGPQSNIRSDYDPFAQMMATRGYVVFQPNFRGSTGYGKAFEEAGYRQWGLKMQDDLADGVFALIKEGLVDPTKVCIVGGSYGGYAALMGTIKTPGLYKCAISINGVTDLPEQIAYDEDQIDDDKLAERYIYQRIGNPKTDATMLRDNSVTAHVKDIHVPVLLLAGEEDKNVPFSQSDDLADALDDTSKTYRFVSLPYASHNIFYFPSDARVVYKEVDQFLARYLH